MDTHEQTFARLMFEFLPGEIGDLERLIAAREAVFAGMSQSEKDSYLGLAHFHSTNLLNAVLDSFRTLHQLVRREDASVVITATHNGIAALLRGALEALAIFDWLNNSVDVEIRKKRGYTINYVNLEERGKYYRDLGDKENLEGSLNMFAQEKKVGYEKGYLADLTDKNGKVFTSLTESLPDSTSLCRNFKTPKDLINGAILEMYPGMENAAWLFRWLSGLTHGKHWVNKYEDNGDGTSMRKVNYMFLNISIMTINNALHAITSH